MTKLLVVLCFSILPFYCFAQWNGDTLTGANPVCQSAQSEYILAMIADGSGGAVVLCANTYDQMTNLYAKRIDRHGASVWGAAADTAIPICTGNFYKNFEEIVPDGSGGAYVVWSDNRDISPGSYYDIYLQHINGSGSVLWPANGIKVTTDNTRDHFDVKLCSEGIEGVVVVWDETERTDTTETSKLFAQRYTAAGVAMWGAGGLAVSTAPGLRGGATVAPNGTGGIFIAFNDSRNCTTPEGPDFDNIDIYAQQISSAGVLMWNDGVPVCNNPSNEFTISGELRPNTSVSDGQGGFIILYSDLSQSTSWEHWYCQRLDASGNRMWVETGLPFNVVDSSKQITALQANGTGGMLALWEQRIGEFEYNPDFRAQQIDGNGNFLWGPYGVKVARGSEQIGNTEVFNRSMKCARTSDGAFVFSWLQANTNTLKAQKYNQQGIKQWREDGETILQNNDAYFANPLLIDGTAGTVICSWADQRDYSITSTDIYAAKINGDGNNLNGYQVTRYVTVSNGSWNNPATWLNGLIPASTSDVTILHAVQVTADATCNTIQVLGPAGSVTVTNGVHFLILH